MATSVKVGGGGTYTIKTGSSASMERITRQAASDEVLQRFIERAEKRRPPVDDSGEADLRWGEPSRFTLTEADAPTNPSFTVGGGGPGGDEVPDPEEEGITVLDFDEIDRTFYPDKIRIENPDDPNDYVMVQDTASILFLGRADGIYRRFNFKAQSE